jgi:alkanesulfonate monooxygenase SsuD/methylene tetrahydromethanopterin reductase-like flavin-dependent oxidoreductase (luciferase family)
MFANTMSWVDGGAAVEAVQAAEAAGFESVWAVEHVVSPDDYAFAERVARPATTTPA